VAKLYIVRINGRRFIIGSKLNNNWPKVSSALALHPDWLTKIPESLLTNIFSYKKNTKKT